MLVRPFVRFFISLGGAFALLFVTVSCSSSRLVEGERVFDSGHHQIGSVIGSDIYLQEGADLQVSYLADSRVFLASGASLSGLGRGVKESSLYYESGSQFPQHQQLLARRVDSAETSFIDRFKAHLPTSSESGSRTAAGATVIVGTGYGYHSRYRYHGQHYRRPQPAPPRKVSVKPDSYRSRN